MRALTAATPLRRLCLFNCKLAADETEALQYCLQDKGFEHLEELDLGGNSIEASQMQALLGVLHQQEVAPKLKVVHELTVVSCQVLLCQLHDMLH